MAERLTEIGMFIDMPVYKIKNGKKSEAVDKLAQLEDIMEKYGIESVEELDKRLQNLFELTCGRKNGKTIARKIILFDKMKQDRDTWKRACELACEVLRDINYKIYNEDRINFENTFYQQAKKEGNDE